MDRQDRKAWRAAHRVRRHVLLFAGVNTGVLIADLLLPGPVLFIYPLVFWSAALAMHVFYVRAVHLDPSWAEDRTRRVRRLSYDHRHIEQIESAPQGAGAPGRDEPADGEAAEAGGQPCRPRM